MASSTFDFSITTYNLHGINQGAPVLNELCDRNYLHVDCVCIQESWATVTNLAKLRNFNKDYTFYGMSAMEKTLSAGVLKGRPFGGVGILLKTIFCKEVIRQEIHERFVVLVLKNIIIISLYLPCCSAKNREDIITEVFENLKQITQPYTSHHIICAGDYNSDLVSPNASLLRDYLNDLRLVQNSNVLNTDSVKYTYANEALNHFSYIDHILVSKSIVSKIIKYEVIDNAINLSDHFPVLCVFKLDYREVFQMGTNSKSYVKNTETNDNLETRIRWDHANIAAYHDYTYYRFADIWDDLRNNDSVNIHSNLLTGTQASIDNFYTTIVTILTEASKKCIPQKRKSCYKFWWDREAQEIKDESIKTHKLWIKNGRPRQGPIFESKCLSKKQYRHFISEKKKNENKQISDQLHDVLLNKDRVAFWKTWNRKFNNKNCKSNVVNGLSNDTDIANAFAEVFVNSMNIGNINDVNADRNLINSKLLHNYKGDFSTDANISVELVDSVIKKLKNGKAVDCENLSYEHFLYCHPIVICVITKLFNVILESSTVPSSFGLGILVPILKGQKKSYNNTEDYRGITICNILSKILEHCLLLKCSKFFKCSNRQFGFQKEIGCSHAIFTMRIVANRVCQEGSTLNVCSLDLSKAFDRIDHKLLVKKLIERNLPKWFISTIVNWYGKLWSKVKWGNSYSEPFKITKGVRQGGVLSPIFFSIFVDEIFETLEKTKMGCFIRNSWFNALM